MVNEDKELYNFMQKGLQDLAYTQEKKKALQHVIKQHMLQQQDKGWKRLFKRISNFMNTTYEVSLLHVGAGLAAIVIIVNLALFSGSLPALQMKSNTSQVACYLQQTTVNQDGSIRIVYVPIYEEER